VQCYAELGIASSNLADCVTAGEEHGTAVAEAVMDMAPAASLYVSNASSQAELAAAITWMTGAGVKIINFSQGSVIPEGMGDGLSIYPNSTYGLVDLAVSRGALFVASAGNEGETSWMGPTTDADADGWIEFAPGDEANHTNLTAGDEVFVGIRWASAASDYDLSIWQGQTQIAVSAESQAETRDPAELIPFIAPSTGSFEIRIRRDAGPAAPTMRLMVVGEAESLDHRTAAGSLPTPADSRNPGLVTVGAVDYRSPTIVEPYSSRGPTFDGRVKPDLVAVDCAPTVILAVFCGTSEAAPYVSGAAALILESDPTLTPAQLAAYLRSHATPLGSPVPNNDSGHGLLALGALPGGVPAALTFLAPAASGAVGAPFLGQPVVGITDATGQLVTKGPGSILPVTLGVATNAGGGNLACDSGLTVTAVAGIARFSGCSLDMAGSGYVLRADATGLTGAVGAPFIVDAAGTPPSLSLAASSPVVTYGASLG
jgi:subtilisin family serine protease